MSTGMNVTGTGILVMTLLSAEAKTIQHDADSIEKPSCALRKAANSSLLKDAERETG
jgi:hypothetical protein